MSQENVEIVRRGFEAAFRTPEPDFATMNALYHPDHELISLRDALEGETHHGARGYRDWQLDTQETLPWETTLEKVTELDDDRVLVVMPTRSRGTSSGVVLDQKLASIVTVRGGKILRTEVYPSTEEALKAVGLGE
jgi:ketosteroid isomerase-like protein